MDVSKMIPVILDENYEVLCYVDAYKAFLWTINFSSCGDFELKIPLNSPYRKYMVRDNYVYYRESDRLMIIETTQVSEDTKYGTNMTIKGRSLESLLDRRIIWDRTILTGNFQDAILRIFNANFIAPNNSRRTIPNFTFKKSEDSYINSLTIDDELHGENIYDFICDKCDVHKIGFRITPNFNTAPGGFIFEFYNGTDYSWKQDERPWITFSSKMKNIVDTNYVESSQNLKTAILSLASGTDENRPQYEFISETLPFTGLARRETTLNSRVSENKINIEDFGTPEDRVNYDDYYKSELMFDNGNYNMAMAQAGGIVMKNWFYYYNVMRPEDNPEYQTALNKAQAAINREYNTAVANERQRIQNEMKSEVDEVFAEHTISKALDCNLASNIQYVYGKDYTIGDKVQVVDLAGNDTASRIVQICFSNDSDGMKMTPGFETI